LELRRRDAFDRDFRRGLGRGGEVKVEEALVDTVEELEITDDVDDNDAHDAEEFDDLKEGISDDDIKEIELGLSFRSLAVCPGMLAK
jgi:hypothetical protein